ncbi:MAG: PQQ-binding-like beta-propeller repeat protein [Chloroflexi bacterium]|nr:PQQ-binding-like beta-propeller repeat protein [Chloroflexota bacterium]
MRTRLLLSVAPILALTLLIVPMAAGARQTTPPASGVSAQRPDCPAPPVSPAGLTVILREPAPDDPDADDPRGDAVPPAERAAIGEVLTTWRICLASGDVPGLLGLFTPDGVRRLLGERSPFLGGPAGIRISILAVSQVERLADGRIAARVVVDPSSTGSAAPESLIVVVEQGEDRVWRFDNLRTPQEPVGVSGVAGPDSAAPPRALLRHPIAPGPGVPIHAPGPTVPMRGADAARTGIQVGPAPDTEPPERWRTPTGWHSDAQPVVARGLVYFGGFSLGERVPLLEAVDAASGGIRWQTSAPVAWAEFPDSPALAGEVLFAPVQAPVAGVLAVVAATGEPLWFSPFGFTSVTAPAADADAVYVAGWGVRNERDRMQNDASGTVFALDQRTGRERWRFLAPARFGTVSVGTDTVYVPSDRGLFAIDRSAGSKRWQARFSPGAGESATVAGDTLIFAGSEVTSGRTGVFALDAATGALRWRVDLPRTLSTRAGTSAANSLVFVTSWDMREDDPGRGSPALRAYELATGEERWVFEAIDSAVGDSEQPIGAGSITPPVVVADNVLFGVAVRASAPGPSGSVDGLYAVAIGSGELRWRASIATPIRSAPAVLDGKVYAMGGLRARGGTSGGNLFAFGSG